MLEGCIKGIEENGSRVASPSRPTTWSARSKPGTRVIVGVNDFTEGNDDADLEILRITNEDERKQVARLNDVRGARDDAKVLLALEELTRDALDPE